VLLEGQEFRSKIGGIITHSRKSRWGKDYVKNESMFRELIKDLKIISYAGSEEKYLLVTGLKNEGFVVGVTSTNPSDTKALLKADIAFTLDELGSEVTKHSSDVILSNDSLKSVVSGIMWGRNLFTNVKRYLQFYLTYVFVLTFVVLLGTLIEGNTPFSLFQLLWLHILTEFIALFALVRDRPSYETLLENSVNYDKKLLSYGMWRSIIMNGIYEIIVLSLVQYFGLQSFEEDNLNLFENWQQDEGMTFTMMFQILFYFQICNILFAKNIKSYEYNFFGHLWGSTGLVILFITVVQVLIVSYSEPVLKFPNLDIYSHVFTLFLGLSPLLWGTIVK
jgi:Ca2+ transporting ATPase